MVISKDTIEKIQEIIAKYHNALVLRVVGAPFIPRKKLNEMKEQNLDISVTESIPEQAYYHNWINSETASNKPLSYAEMRNQQQSFMLPVGEAHTASIEHLNSNFLHLMEKQKMDVLSRMEGFIRDTNNSYKMNALQNLDRPDSLDELVKEGEIPGLKRKLRDSSDGTFKNWDRIVNTELSNAIGLGSADRVVSQNKEQDLNEVYVYRIAKEDGDLCRYCRQFYLDADGSPKVYRFTTLLGNGTNFGLKADHWRPTVTATHPNERCSQILELKPGWKVLKGGAQTYMGLDKWKDYIHEKVTI